MSASAMEAHRKQWSRQRRGVRRYVAIAAVAAATWMGCASDATTPVGAPAQGPVTSAVGGSPAGAQSNTPVQSNTPTTSTMTPPNTQASGQASNPPSSSTTPPPSSMPGSVTTPPPSTQPGSMPMAEPGASTPKDTGTPTLFWLEIGSNRVFRASADGSGAKQIASGAPLSAPDGVAVDPVAGFVYVLNMGVISGGGNNASLVRYKLDGTDPQVLIPPGSKVDNITFNTGKQVTLDRANKKLYMADREGGKVWRADVDGKNLEILVSGHDIMQVVGIGVDVAKKQFYFSDKPGHKIFRASTEMPAGKTHADRDDVELLYFDSKARVGSSLDIELDLEMRRIYWTDKDQNIVFGMSMDLPAGQAPETRTDVEHVVSNMTGVIGIAFDDQERMLYTTNTGSVSSFKPDGSMLKRIGMNGSTGISFVRVP